MMFQSRVTPIAGMGVVTGRMPRPTSSIAGFGCSAFLKANMKHTSAAMMRKMREPIIPTPTFQPPRGEAEADCAAGLFGGGVEEDFGGLGRIGAGTSPGRGSSPGPGSSFMMMRGVVD